MAYANFQAHKTTTRTFEPISVCFYVSLAQPHHFYGSRVGADLSDEPGGHLTTGSETFIQRAG